MTQMVTTDKRLAKVDEWLNAPSTLAKIASMVPKHQRAERIVKLAWMQISGNKDLASCTMRSIAECVMTCAQLGLEPNSVSQHAHFIPFRDNKSGTRVCTLVPGYKGLIDLATRSGRILTVRARVVRVGDFFEHCYEPPMLVHRPADADAEDLSSPICFAYAVAVHNDQWHHREFETLSKKAIDLIRSKCQAKSGNAWVNFYEEMGMKSAVRRLCKYMPASVELASAITLDEQADNGMPQTLIKVDDDFVDMPDDLDSQNGEPSADEA